MIQLRIRSRTKSPTPSVVRNPISPKNLRLRNPGRYSTKKVFDGPTYT